MTASTAHWRRLAFMLTLCAIPLAVCAETNVTADVAVTTVVTRLLEDFTGRAEALTAGYGWARTRIAGVYLWQVLWSFGIIFCTIVVARIFDHVMHTKLARALARRNVPYGDKLITSAHQPVQAMIYLGGTLVVASVMLIGHPHLWHAADKIAQVVLTLLVIWLADRCIDVVAHVLLERAKRTTTRMDEQLVIMGRKTSKIIVLILAVIVLLDTLNINVTALVTGLGIGGLAVALALQDTLANFFSSVFIMIDRPFKIGDRIVAENVDGVVENIGFRSTRIRTLAKSQVTIPNRMLTNASVDNITRMHKRRVNQTVGVTYDTSADKMEQTLEALRAVLRDDPEVDQESTIVRFHDFGESSLNIMVVYFTAMADLQQHLAVRERINMKFMRALAALGVSIAFPTRTLHLDGEIARRMVER